MQLIVFVIVQIGFQVNNFCRLRLTFWETVYKGVQ